MEAEKPYQHQFIGMSATGLQVGYAHFAAMELRVVLKGSETIIGIVPEKIPGANAKEKRKALFSSPFDTVQKLVADGGFAFEHGDDKAAVLPTGYFYAIASEGCTLLRWSLSSDDNDTHRQAKCLKDLLDSFPELRKPNLGMQSCLEHLSATL